jgi:hypothetical protein
MRLDLDRARSESALGDRTTARKHATLARDHAKTAGISWLADDANTFLISNPAAQVPPPATVAVEPVAIEPKPVEPKSVAVEPAETPTPTPTVKPPMPKAQPKKDVGVYGSAQTW